QQGGIVATGTVTYSRFANGTCTAPPASTQTVTLTASGAVPGSSSTGALGAGSYAFQAAYAGDANYTAVTSACEPFTVAVAATAAATSVIDDATGTAWSNTEQTGPPAHDTATVSGQQG